MGKHEKKDRSARGATRLAVSALVALAMVLTVPITFHLKLQDSSLQSNESALQQDNILESGDTETAFAGGLAPDLPQTEIPEASFIQQVSFIDQYPELPTGCESVALTVVLRSLGFDLGVTTIVDSYLEYSEADFVNAYVGDPYSYEGMGAYPPAMANAANKYLVDQSSKMRAHDITGTAWEDLFFYVDKGYPVLIWSTVDYYEPLFTGDEYNGWPWYENEHCVVLYAFDREAGQISLSDPTNGDISYDAEAFRQIYEDCGKMAVVIY